MHWRSNPDNNRQGYHQEAKAAHHKKEPGDTGQQLTENKSIAKLKTTNLNQKENDDLSKTVLTDQNSKTISRKPRRHQVSKKLFPTRHPEAMIKRMT